jgi:uncharacterized protein YjbI with pentapeptide repeats
MANEEQVKILRKGVDAWNRWRADNPKIVPDLSGAELVGAELPGVNFTGAKLDGANLTGADLGIHVADFGPLFEALGVPGAAPKSFGFASLKGASLKKADLSKVLLTAADLRSADLEGANLSFSNIDAYSMEPGEVLSYGITMPANLSGAQLKGALLYKTTIQEAILNGASFDGALIARARFSHVDLSRATNLHNAVHLAPAGIDLDTLELTAAGLNGKASDDVETFLRDAGLPSEYLDSFQRRLNSGKFYSCFISHSSEDQTFCRKLYYRMKAEGLRVWYSPENVQGGHRLYEQIKGAIRAHDKLLLVLSEHSMRSSWVELEIREALEYEREKGQRKLFPISVTNFSRIKRWKAIDADTGQDLAVRIREYFVPDFSRWKDEDAFEAAFGRLLSDLRGSEVMGVSPPSSKDEADFDSVIARVWQ